MKNLRILFALAICWAICSAIAVKSNSEGNQYSAIKDKTQDSSGEINDGARETRIEGIDSGEGGLGSGDGEGGSGSGDGEGGS
ncbi:unnamed protein product, partial [Hymenolepis diminuta]